ncbi:23S rRNA (cytidine(2498)-2'-O)-methyltransferase RlmM [Luteimonas saliphila]|uniref:23S rRNA (cytidine(2498)-2'-O)-methyltransferase RlmM n=1 Tax=Luteimonas saliphila TaxID=2804919 RepID=UPI00192DD86E|nr:23S rRNA (cytidine(2498)-2'-O)-methyltransferase RlmM [Luteimonas saliphila]
MNGLLCYCRAGFEPDLAAELGDRAAEAGIAGYARATRGEGYLLFLGDDSAMATRLPWRSLVFARQSLRLFAELRDLDPRDRIAPMLEAIESERDMDPGRRAPYGELWVEHPDSDAGKPLSGLARSFGNALRPVLRKRGLLAASDDPRLPRLHVCFVAGDHALLADSDPADSAPWPLGVPRLRLHADAPSRSALKLEEALLTLLDDTQRREWLRPGMTAADLGAAPGGWTWVLARHGLRVIAIDNGPLRPHLLETGLVEHLRADGFHWQPARPLDWMVCDMVEQPTRVARRVGEWFREGWCRHAIFNLKLPMKKRWLETRRSLDAFRRTAQAPLVLRARQLYHDREEITVHARRVSAT